MPEPTKGPWVAAPTIHPGEVRGPHGPVAYVSLAVPIEQRHATVSVLAAALEMLEALEGVVRLTKVQHVLEKWELGSLNAIIAKAKGE